MDRLARRPRGRPSPARHRPRVAPAFLRSPEGERLHRDRGGALRRSRLTKQPLELVALDAPEPASGPVAIEQRDFELIGWRGGLLPLTEHLRAEASRGPEIQ